ADRQDGLELTVPAALGGATCRVALDDEQFRDLGVARRAVRQLARQAAALEHRLAGDVARLAGGHPCPRRLLGLAHDPASLGRVLLEPFRELLVDGNLHERAHVAVAELRLALALALRRARLDR